jgi:hypothetical protein
VALDEFNPLTYQLGLAGVVGVSVVLLGAIQSGRARLSEHLLSLAPLRWVGLRSYSIYLWHWPIYAVTRPQIDLPYVAATTLAIRIAATMVCAELSYRLVERPVRHRAARALAEAPAARVRQRQTALLASGLCLVAVTLGATAFVPPSTVASASEAPAAPEQAEQSIHLAATAILPTPLPTVLLPDDLPGGAPPTVAPEPTAPPTSGAAAMPATALPTPTLAPEQRSTLVVGDSVMVGAARELQAALAGQTVEIDAAVGRQIAAATRILRARRDAGTLGSAVVIQIGNNSPISSREFDEMIGLLGDVPQVLVVNLKVPRRWQDPNNEILARGVARYPNARLLDWRAASAEHPEYFRRDGLHLLPAGQRALAALIVQALQQP